MKAESFRRIWRVFWGILVQFNRHNCPIMAAGMSFFGMLSLVPLTLLGVSLLGYILGSSQDAQQFVFKLLTENFPSSAEEILGQINAIVASPDRTFVNWLSVLGLIWSGMRFFTMLQRVLNNIWVGATQRWFLRGRLAAIVSFAVAGMLFWASFVLSSLMAAARELDIAFGGVSLRELQGFWRVMELAPPFFASVVMLFLVYLFVPHVSVSPRAAFIGSASATVFLQISRQAFSFLMVRFDVYGRVYGPLASFIMFMSWLYVSMTIILLGAELGSRCQEMLRGADGVESEAQAECIQRGAV